MREQTNTLKHIAEIASQQLGVLLQYIAPIDQYLATTRLFQPINHLQRSRLAATGRTDKTEEFTPLHNYRGIGNSQGGSAVIGFLHITQFNYELVILTNNCRVRASLV